ncbi:hypothetical protein TNCV_430271 [Trichonephila clavipes]|nr:hypothetical protein TNCV_430271 [Trichonephila clavipes]
MQRNWILVLYSACRHVAAVAEWYWYRNVACFVMGSSPVPLKTRRVGQRCTLNLSRAETSSRWLNETSRVIFRISVISFEVLLTKLISLSFKYIKNSPKPPLGKELSKDPKDTIIKLYKESKSQRQIVKIIGKYPATVQKLIEKFQAEGNTLNKPITGRPPIFTDRERPIIVGNVTKNPEN